MDRCRLIGHSGRVFAGFEARVKPRRIPPPLPSILWILGAILSWPHAATAQVDVASIIQHSTEANERDWAAVPEFDNSERDRNKDGEKTYAVTMLYGSPYERVIAVNGDR